jgi:cation diffusion facilitator CzcD-associated flavoprotein CzcO
MLGVYVTKELLFILTILSLLLFTTPAKANTINCDVLVVGGSTSGVAAAIQSARLGVKTCLVEETDWLGGMYTAAGISAFDGPLQNYYDRNPYASVNFSASSGIFREIEERIHWQYCGQGIYPCKGLANGSVSVSAFEPSVARTVLNDLVKDLNDTLFVYYNTTLVAVNVNEGAVLQLHSSIMD